ncbi:MAG TPA: hypothetical protein VFQ48_01550, partial [Pseudonocardiaceae bacterium]|nr:hypothetical protein [Pseudonocardiaceae bacterium]
LSSSVCPASTAFPPSGSLQPPAPRAVHDAAVAAGAEILHAPREWPEYHPGYYGVFLRDLDGHNVEAVHHGHH